MEHIIPGDYAMALVSPGVEVTVIDESFYTPAEPGTTPLIVVATAQDKINGSGTGTASATTKANAGKAFRLTSQKDLVDLFGVPFFETTVSGSPIHGGERNEYGLLAAYSLLGVTNSVFMVRADVDLDQLEGTTSAPGAKADDGQWWVNTSSTAWGIQEWNSNSLASGGQKFTAKTPLILTDDDAAKITGNTPLAAVGSIGDYAVVFETGTVAKETAKIFYKSAGNAEVGVFAGDWVLVGSPEWAGSIPAVEGTAVSGSVDVTGLVINNTAMSGSYTLSALATYINSTLSITGVTAQVVSSKLYLYTDGTSAADGDASDSTGADGAILLENGGGKNWSSLGITAGLYYGPRLQQSPHTSVPLWKRTDLSETVRGAASGSVWIKTTEPNFGARWRASRWSTASKSWEAYDAPLYASGNAALYYLDRSGGGANIPVDSLFVQFNTTENSGFDSTPGTAEFRVWRRANPGATTVTSGVVTTQFVDATNYAFTIEESLVGTMALDSAKSVAFTGKDSAVNSANEMAAKINAAGFTNIEASVTADNRVQIQHKAGGDFRLTDGLNSPLSIFSATNVYSGGGVANLYTAPAGSDADYVASNWRPLGTEDFVAAGTAPLNEPTDGQLWYNTNFGEIDIMIHDGSTWVGYRNELGDTDPEGPIVSASQPVNGDRSDGGDLVDGDLWISTADLENFPTIYRWNSLDLEWVLLDKADQTTENGVLFADARWTSGPGTGTESKQASDISDLLVSDHLDPDAPDPDLYPKGMLLYNLRRSGGNIKRYANSYIDVNTDNVRLGGTSMANYETDRWVTASANNEDGSGSFGRKAQRKVVVAAMKSVLDTSQEIRDEERRNFNLIAAPQYPECLSNLINLNIDRGLTAFVVGDTPLRLPSDATSLVNWGTNAALVTDNGDDGIVSYDEYCAVYYPNGFTTDLSGNNAVVPASHMMLRTIALSDQVSYPWFAPAGTRRGGITNATSVGYIDAATGEFQTVALNEGTRDVLYDLKVNPIPFFVGSGLVAWGQKTRGRNASALDRINVSRLTAYLRAQLNKLARPYIFEPNDKITRDEIKGAVESLLLELVGLRAIYDFVVVCDESNNTPSRIDRNELYVDIAIEPVKALEFIYIPLRVKNTGEI